MLARWLSGLEPVHRATTREERESIYRFRYTVYVEELGRRLGTAHHETRTVWDDDDEAPYTLHMYTGTPQSMTGSLRVRFWEPGRIPEYDFKTFNMQVFPGIETTRVSEVGRLMIRPSMRGKLLLPAIARAAYEFLVAEFDGVLAFCYGAPGLVPHYQKLGFRLYDCPLVPTPDGMNIGMVSVLSDGEHLKRVGSPASGLPERYFTLARRRRDLERYAHLFNEDALRLEIDPARVWERVEHDLTSAGTADDKPSFLEGLPRDVMRLLTSKGFIVDVSESTLVTREGHGDREMFVVLEGSFEVIDQSGRRIALLAKGDLFGEVAFFRESGRRSATVRAVTDGQVLVIRRRFLNDLRKDNPRAAAEILFRLGRILSERLAGVLQERQMSKIAAEEG
ncbi:MAG: cyclic nucleotide-binding domain-containing protein [Ectothiorhodospiraceae bacterium]|nr:cyclic nucleotide-binding domain-containing protein [Chromatiales bacterium]MCP5154886.1 cyclic nucleotide-binding domain-containing protein [Ectothiorhodospiraceae bacterium]